MSHSDIPFDENLIFRHLNKECTPEETIVVSLWMDASEDNCELYLKIKQLWAFRKVGYYSSDLELKQALARVNHKIQSNNQQRRRKTIRKASKYAAAVIFLLGGFLMFYSREQQTTQWVTITTNHNEPARILTLPDSTKVWLNENTTISYPESFVHRSVKISGEAFFEVTHNEIRPFTVEANTMQIRVLGTSFNIKALETDSFIQTTLISGNIELYNNNILPEPLYPGQQAIYNRHNNELKIQNVKTDLYTSWRAGLVIFDKAHLADILSGIEDAYDVRIIYNTNKHSAKQYNFVFRKNQPLETVLDMLKFVAPVNFKINNNELYVNE